MWTHYITLQGLQPSVCGCCFQSTHPTHKNVLKQIGKIYPLSWNPKTFSFWLARLFPVASFPVCPEKLAVVRVTRGCSSLINPPPSVALPTPPVTGDKGHWGNKGRRFRIECLKSHSLRKFSSCSVEWRYKRPSWHVETWNTALSLASEQVPLLMTSSSV